MRKHIILIGISLFMISMLVSCGHAEQNADLGSVKETHNASSHIENLSSVNEIDISEEYTRADMEHSSAPNHADDEHEENKTAVDTLSNSTSKKDTPATTNKSQSLNENQAQNSSTANKSNVANEESGNTEEPTMSSSPEDKVEDTSIPENSTDEQTPTPDTHTHQWQEVTSTKEYNIPATKTIAACNGCGSNITSSTDEHMKNEMLAGNIACGGYHTENIESGYCYFCGDGFTYRVCGYNSSCKTSETFVLITDNCMYYDVCVCGKNTLMKDSSTGKGLIKTASYYQCIYCKEKK